MRSPLLRALLLLCAACLPAAAEEDPAPEVARFDLARGAADTTEPASPLVRRIGRPRRTPEGMVFDGSAVQGLVYGDGARGELRLRLPLSVWVRAAFAPEQARHLANHDTLVSRWGQVGSYAFLLRSDHDRRTLHLFLSPDGRSILPFDSRCLVPRDGVFHDYLVVVRPAGDVRFFVDGILQSVVRDPVPPAGLHGTDAADAPFAIGYNSDPAPGGDHESMNGTIAELRVFAQALDAEQAAALSGLDRVPQEPDHVTVRIHLDAEGPVVSPRLFGVLLEHFPRQLYGAVFEPGSSHADAGGFRTDVLDALREAGTTVVRWPGGNYASGYDWRWGAGPRAERVSRAAPHWGFEEDHGFGTTEYAELVRRIGGEALICVGVGRDPRCPTPADAAAWVRYCNATSGAEARLRARAGREEPLDVTLWGLGNEVWGPWQIGHYRDPGEYALDVVRYARAMRAADPRVQFVVVGNDLAWNEQVLTRDVVRVADWISWHDYFHLGVRGARRSHEEATEHLAWVEQTLKALGAQARRCSREAGRTQPLLLAVDEWNELGWAEERPAENDRPEIYDLAHALYTAGFLDVLLRRSGSVGLACYAPGVNGRGFVCADRRGVLRRTTFHVLRLYGRAAGGRLLPASTTSPRLSASTAAALDVACVRAADGHVLVFLVNREKERGFDVRLDLTPPPKLAAATAEVLTADSLGAYDDFPFPDRVTSGPLPLEGAEATRLAVPPRSLVLLELLPAP